MTITNQKSSTSSEKISDTALGCSTSVAQTMTESASTNSKVTDTISILSLYSFVNIASPELLMQKIILLGKKKSLKGTILIAKEGFNGSVSGTYENVHIMLDELIKLTSATDVNTKVNYANYHPFDRFKVKLKPEIIAMNEGDIDVNNQKGEYIETAEWDRFITRSDVVLVDTRNDYEIEVGTFKNAINPLTDTFKQFPAWVKNNHSLLAGKKIAMCCTGGVRCEKSTAYLKSLGYDEVYHLKGGILQYLEDTENKNNIWQGECFVFDERRSVDDKLRPHKAE